jgi:hypothetical protein
MSMYRCSNHAELVTMPASLRSQRGCHSLERYCIIPGEGKHQNADVQKARRRFVVRTRNFRRSKTETD